MEKIKLKDIKKGDCFAYKIVNNERFKGRYIIACETDLKYPEYPIYHFMRMKITKGDKLPETEEEINNLEDMITDITFMEGRFFPFNSESSIDEQIKERSKVKVYPDEFDYLYSYTMRVRLNRKLYKDFIYLGKFEINSDHIPYPEFIPFYLFNLIGGSDRNFESILLDRYTGYNLKECELWNYTKEEREARKKESQFVIDVGKRFE